MGSLVFEENVGITQLTHNYTVNLEDKYLIDPVTLGVNLSSNAQVPIPRIKSDLLSRPVFLNDYWVGRPPTTEKNNYHFQDYLLKNLSKLDEAEFVVGRRNLMKLFMAGYNSKEDFEIFAMKTNNGTIHLKMKRIPETRDSIRNQWGMAFENYLRPEKNPQDDDVMGVFKGNFGGIRCCFSGEIDGMYEGEMAEIKLTHFEKLNFCKKNGLATWLQCYLSGVTNVIFGQYVTQARRSSRAMDARLVVARQQAVANLLPVDQLRNDITQAFASDRCEDAMKKGIWILEKIKENVEQIGTQYYIRIRIPKLRGYPYVMTVEICSPETTHENPVFSHALYKSAETF